MLSINNIVRSIEFVIRVGAGTVNACLVLNVTFNDNCKTENGELRIRGIKSKITMVMFILLNNVTTDAESVHHFVLSTNEPFV
jgi:hypothetical protein